MLEGEKKTIGYYFSLPYFSIGGQKDPVMIVRPVATLPITSNGRSRRHACQQSPRVALSRPDFAIFVSGHTAPATAVAQHFTVRQERMALVTARKDHFGADRPLVIPIVVECGCITTGASRNHHNAVGQHGGARAEHCKNSVECLVFSIDGIETKNSTQGAIRNCHALYL
jgi:hypothetical protein